MQTQTQSLQDGTKQTPYVEADRIQFLTFCVGEAEYGVDIMSVREIRGWTEATRLPNMPTYMRGVINLRGAIIPIFDLRCRFGAGLTQVQAKNVIVILAIGERNCGLLVDAVSDIVTIDRADIKEAPDESDHAVDQRFVRGLLSLQERMVILLDIARLFHNEGDISSASIPSPSAA